MLIFAIDDEIAALEELHGAIAQAEPSAEIMDFETAGAALAAIREQGKKPDVVFSDIRLPGMDGLNLAVQIKNEAPYAKIIFVTGYSQYMGEAYRRHVIGYLMKPATPEKIREELDAIELLQAAPEPDKLRVQCFGSFEVFWHDKPLVFPRSKSKELLAYLVDREGAYCTMGEIISALWEDGAEGKDAKHYLRVLASELSSVLKEIGMKDALLKQRGQWAVNRDKVDCDYYRMRDGDSAFVNAYRGEYMKQYSWAELTAGRLHFQSKEH